MQNADVLVVGAGPAGSLAALTLARAGVRVRIVDRASFPRDKLCGDTLNPGALALLDRAGVATDVRRLSLAVSGMVVTGPGGVRVVGKYGPGVYGAALTRRDLDEALLRAAIRAGAEFDDHVHVRQALVQDGRVTGVLVGGRAGEHRVRARLVLAADGRYSRLAFQFGLARLTPQPRRWAFGAYYHDVEGLSGHGEMHIRPGGYTGIAPVPGGLANVCVVREWQPGGAARLQGDVIARAIAADPMLADRFWRARRVGPPTVLGPLGVESLGAGLPGLLLAGDAAGFIDPMTGDGLRFAIRGAELAADAALGELGTGAPAHTRLARERRREFAGKWRLNQTLRSLVGSPRTVSLAATFASVAQAPVRWLIRTAGDVAAAERYRTAGTGLRP